MILNDLLSKIFKALSHPTRLNIVNELMDGEKCVCKLQIDENHTQGNLSQHLKILRDADVLDDRKIGNNVFYKIKYDEIIDIINLSHNIINKEIKKLKELE